MPSTTQSGTAGREIPSFNPTLEAQHGENPARYLTEPLSPDDGSGSRGQLVLARIRGIVTVDLCRLWLAYERRLADRYDREPRTQVVNALEERIEHLQEHGEGFAQDGASPEELRDRGDRLREDHPELVESDLVILDEGGNERERNQFRSKRRASL